MNSWQQPVSGEPSVGTLHLIPEEDRPSSWVLSGGTATSFTDVDFGAYVPLGVKALLLGTLVIFSGNAANDYCIFEIRRNGSTETDAERLSRVGNGYLNLGSGYNLRSYTQLTVGCDTNGVIEYRHYHGTAATGLLYLNIEGYYI